MGHLFRLPAGGFKEYRCPHPPVNVPQRAFGIGVQRLGVGGIAGDVRHNGRVQPLLAQLPQQRSAEGGIMQRRGTQRNQRLPARLPVLLLGRQRNPLRQHRQGAAGLLKLRHRPPLALKHRQRSRMKRVARLKSPPQKLPRFGIGGGAVHRRPLGGQPGVALKAPVGVSCGDLPPHTIAAQILKQTPAHHLADFRLIVGDEILRHPVHHLGDALLPFLIPAGHLHLTARQADDSHRMTGTGNRHRQILQKGVKRFGHIAMPIEKVQRFVKQQQRRPVGGCEHPPQRLGARRRILSRAAQRGHPGIAAQLPRQINPRRFPPLRRIPGIAHEHPHPRRRRRAHAGRCQQLVHAGKLGGVRPGPRQVVQRRQRMRLAAPELRHQRQRRRRIRRLPRQPPQRHPAVLGQRPGKTGARKKLPRIGIVRRRRSPHHLLQCNGKLIRAERTPFPHFLARRYHTIPGFHRVSSLITMRQPKLPTGYRRQ